MLKFISYILLWITLVKPSFAQTVSESVIKKCLCEDDKIPSENGCVPHNQTFVHVWDPVTEVSEDVHVKEFGSVIVKPLDCHVKEHRASINSLALVLPSGNIFPYPEPETDSYCIEYFLDSSGNIRQRYEVCVHIDPIKLCCPIDQTISGDGKCQKQPKDRPQLQLWPKKFEYVIENVECKHEQPHKMIEVNDDPMSIKAIYDGDSILANETCLVAHEYAGNVSYYRKSCECDKVTCISDCCPSEMAFDTTTSTCVLSNSTYNPQNLHGPQTNVRHIPHNMVCDGIHKLNFSNGQYHILPDGSLQTDGLETFPLHQFCLGVIKSGNQTSSSGLACFKGVAEDSCAWRFLVIRIFLGISCFFITLTLIVYLGIKTLRNRIGGACLISELVALLISQVVLVIIQSSQQEFSSAGCLTAGVIELVFILASFFWLNIMCFDVWSTFRVLRPFNEKLLNIKLFIKYSLYGWGIPIIIGCIVIAVEVKELEPRPSFVITEGCFFVSSASDLAAQWIYLYGIILVLLTMNCAFFVHVGAKLLPLHMEQRKMLKESRKTSQSGHDIENFKLYAKLFVIMGLPWLFEVFTSFALDAHECYIWVLDIFNLLRGVLIFIIFVCKDGTREKIKARWFSRMFSSNDVSNSGTSRFTSAMSLSSWLPNRKASKADITPKFEVNSSETTAS